MQARWLAVVLPRVRFALVESAGCGFPFFAGVGCPLLKFSATHPGRGGDAGASQPPGSQSVSMAACLGEASVTGEGFSFSEPTLRLDPALSPKRHLSFRGRRGPARWCCRGPRRAIGVSYAVRLNCTRRFIHDPPGCVDGSSGVDRSWVEEAPRAQRGRVDLGEDTTEGGGAAVHGVRADDLSFRTNGGFFPC